MRVTTPEFTVVEYCQQLERGEVVVNREYQRSPEVWPTAAQSYLIETMLLGYPIPKMTLVSKTDLKSRRTIKEIVDGQQRSMAILRFYNDSLRLSRRSTFGPRLLSQLPEEHQQRFLEYPLSIDLLVDTTDAEVRELFRRINSYTVPLNAAEIRHATYQGEFKWFVVETALSHSESLKAMGVFSESQLSRMADEALITEIVLAMETGIQTANPSRLRELYEKKDEAFPEAEQYRAQIDAAMGTLASWSPLHGTGLMKPYNFYSLILAVINQAAHVAPLAALCVRGQAVDESATHSVERLSRLADALEEPERYPSLREFVEAGSSATNTLKRRQVRFRAFCEALGGQPDDTAAATQAA